MVLRVVRQYGLASHFSPMEKEFIRDPEPPAEIKARFLKRYEAAWVLLWALEYVGMLETPNSICNVPFAVACMRERRTQTFISEARLRPIDQILDQADLVYRYHWPLGNPEHAAQARGAGLNQSVVNQRHLALNWLIRYRNREWDRISTEA